MYFERKAYLKELISAEGNGIESRLSPASTVVVNPSSLQHLPQAFA